MTLSGRSGVRAEQLDELDLRDVRVLELVDEDVAVLALPSAQHVRPALEELGHRRDLLAEVERSALDQLLLVRPIDRCDLVQPHHLERRPVRDVGVGELVDRCPLLVGVPVAVLDAAGPADGAASLEVGRLHRSVEVGVLVRPFVATELAVGAAHVADGLEVAVDEESSGRIGVAAVSVLEDPLLAGDEGVEVVRRDELVLRPVDELHELRQVPGGRVIDQAEVRAELAEQEQLADPVEDVRVAGHVRIGRALAQDPMAEAVEVRDAQAGGGRGAHTLVDPLAQLAGRLDVVGQDEQLLGEEVVLGLQQPADALDDDAGLARSRACDDDDRAVAMLDDGPLGIGQREVLALGRSRRR